MRRILTRLVPLLAMVAGLTVVGGGQVAAKTLSASSSTGPHPYEIWCC